MSKIAQNKNVNQDTLATIKKQLEEKRQQLLEDLQDISDKNNRVKFPDYGDKTDDNVQEIGEYSTNLATDKVLESSLRDIEAALQRIEDGTYGACKYCGEPIDEKRLLARPVASACIKCKTRLQNSK